MQDGDLLASMKGNRVPNHNHVHTFSLLYGVYPAEQTSFVLGLLANQLVCYFGKKNATKLNSSQILNMYSLQVIATFVNSLFYESDKKIYVCVFLSIMTKAIVMSIC